MIDRRRKQKSNSIICIHTRSDGTAHSALPNTTLFLFFLLKFVFIFFNFACKSFLSGMFYIILCCRTVFNRSGVQFFFSFFFRSLHFCILCPVLWRAALHDIPCCTSVDRHYHKIPLHARMYCSAGNWMANAGALGLSVHIFIQHSSWHTHTVLDFQINTNENVDAQFMLRDCIHYLGDTKISVCWIDILLTDDRPVQIF